MCAAKYTRLDAHNGSLHLYRLDVWHDFVLAFREECTGYDADALCRLLVDGGVPVEDAIAWAESFADWWNAHDVYDMIEAGDDRELRNMLKLFRDVGVSAEIDGLRWVLG